MRVVVAGKHIVALRTIEALMVSHEVVYVGPEFDEGERLDRLDVQMVSGEIISPETLREARVDQCDVFVACSRSDEHNILACLAARKLGARRTICVLSSAGFLAIGDDDTLAESLGIDLVVRPAQQLADEIMRIVMVPGALDVEMLAEGRVLLLRYAAEAGAPLSRARLRDLNLPRGALIVAVRRGDELILPSGDTRIEPGDKVIAMGRRRAVQRLLPLLRSMEHGEEKHHAAIVGAGSVGLAVAQALEEQHWRIKVVESDRARCEEIAPKLKGLVLCGDGGDLDLLEQEHVDAVPVLVVVTNNDEKNLLVSLVAKQTGVPRIITRARRLANERMFERIGIDVVRSAHGAAIRTIVRSIDRTESEIFAELEHGDAQIMEVTLPAEFEPTILAKMHPPTLAVVGAILRGRRVLIPDGRTELRPKDHLLVFCMRSDADATRSFFMTTNGH